MKMPIPDRRRCLDLGAALIEADLHRMRECSINMYLQAESNAGVKFDGRVGPLGSSHEGDLMQAVEWATAAATLRMLAEQAATK